MSISRSRKGHRASSHFEKLEQRQLLAAAAAAVHLQGESFAFNDQMGLWIGFEPKSTVLDRVQSGGGFVTGRQTGDRGTLARAFLLDHAGDMGLTAADVNAGAITHRLTDPQTGITYVTFQQMLNGLPIENTTASVNFTKFGEVINGGGTFVPGIDWARSNVAKPELSNMIHPTNALRVVANELGLDYPAALDSLSYIGGADQKFLARDPQLSTGDIPINAQYLATENGVRLTWTMTIWMPKTPDMYNVSVDAQTGELIRAVNGTSYFAAHDVWQQAIAQRDNNSTPVHAGNSTVNTPAATEGGTTATYNVYPQPLESPYDGPRQVLVDPYLSTSGTDPATSPSPYGWQDTDGDVDPDSTQTLGNNVDAHDDINNNNSVTPAERAEGGAGLDFDFPIDFSQEPTVGNNRNAAVVNLFYWNNVLHDFHYKYGFTENWWNFQTNQYGRQNAAGTSPNPDPVQADALDGSGTNNANFSTGSDGATSRMQMYRFTAPTPDRDGDLDAGVIAHEFGHGVTNRIYMNGTGQMSATQSRGMGEGWGDFYGLMLTQTAADTQMGRYPIGTYVLNQDPVTGPGIRRKPYSFDMMIDPLTFGAYGSGTIMYNGAPFTRSTEVHNSGEIWASTLWDLNWLLINKFGYDGNVFTGWNPNGTAAERAGNKYMLRLMIESMRLSVPTNNSFTDARNEILAADQALTGGANQREIWTAFARRGLGANAANQSATSTATITDNFDLPATFDPYVTGATPNGLLANAPIAGISMTFNKPMDPTSFAIADDIVSFTGPGGTNLLPQITGFTWSNSDATLNLTINPQRANGDYSLVLAPTILAAADGHQIDQNANGTPGEPIDDRYTLNITKSGASGPLVTAQSPTGTINHDPVAKATLTFSEAMDQTSFSLADVASFTGPGGVDLSSALSGFTWNNATTLQINFIPQRTNGSYSLVLGPQIAAALDGAQMDQDADGNSAEPSDDRYTFNVSKSGAAGPRITAQLPTSALTFSALSQIDLTFGETINQASFSISDDIASFTGPGGVDLLPQITGSSWQNGGTALRLTLNTQAAAGAYTMVLGPQILGLDNVAMDQDLDGTPGEAAQDAYTASFNITRTVGPEAFGYISAQYPFQTALLNAGDPGVVAILASADDSPAVNLPLGSDVFRYYTTDYTGSSLFVTPNGNISFTTANTGASNGNLGSTPTAAVIAPLWDDWVTNTNPASGRNDQVLYKFVDADNNGANEKLIIQWDVFRYQNTQSMVQFQLIMNLNTGANPGRMVFNYIDLDAGNTVATNGASATTGIKDIGAQSTTTASRRLVINQDSPNMPWVKSNSAIVVDFDVDPPVVSNSSYQFESQQRVNLSFSEDVNYSGANVSAVNLTTGTPVSPDSVLYSPSTFASRINFLTSLADGNYRVTVDGNDDGTGVTDLAGSPLDGDHSGVAGGDFVYDFFFLRGDANRDRSVDIGDFSILAGNFNNPATFSTGDFDYDGTAGIADFSILASKFNTGLAAPRPAVTTQPAGGSDRAPLAAMARTSSPFSTTSVWQQIEEQAALPA